MDNLDKAGSIRKGEELNAAALEKFLLDNVEGMTGKLSIDQFPGGASNLTYLIKMGNREMVLRRPPFGANIKGGHDMGREYKVLHALSKSYSKAPKPVIYTEDESILGAEFYVMDRVQGVIYRSNKGPAKDLPKDKIMAIAESLMDTMAELHNLDYEAIGLGDLGKPDGYTRRQVEGWTRRYMKAKTHEYPELEEVAKWLADNVPSECQASLIHNDFKHDNVIMDPNDITKVMAILDWEMCTIGDPLTDLGTTLTYWPNPEDPPFMKFAAQLPSAIPGNPNRQQLVEMYAEKSGNSINDIVFYFAYGAFKLAGVVQQIYYRYHHGHTQDKRFQYFNLFADGLGKMAKTAIEKNKIYDLG